MIIITMTAIITPNIFIIYSLVYADFLLTLNGLPCTDFITLGPWKDYEEQGVRWPHCSPDH